MKGKHEKRRDIGVSSEIPQNYEKGADQRGPYLGCAKWCCEFGPSCFLVRGQTWKAECLDHENEYRQYAIYNEGRSPGRYRSDPGASGQTATVPAEMPARVIAVARLRGITNESPSHGGGERPKAFHADSQKKAREQQNSQGRRETGEEIGKSGQPGQEQQQTAAVHPAHADQQQRSRRC